jgi:hypothetical protein
MTHLVFLCYGLAEREGEPPEVGVGSTVQHDVGRFVVTRVAASPLPGDSRRCAYLQPA